MRLSNFNITIYVSIALAVASILFLPFSWIGLIFGILYAQTIEWFVHGWVQHHPFKIFKPYRTLHIYHHKYPHKPLAVQPISYFIIGSIGLLLPFISVPGFYFGYFITYIAINIIHYDLHSRKKRIPPFIWKSFYFEWIASHHKSHHIGHKYWYTTYSITNPFLDVLFSALRLDKLNNWIAQKLKI